jgi:hypothetical protein
MNAWYPNAKNKIDVFFIQMTPHNDKTKTFKASKQPFPALLRNFIVIAALAIVAIVISAVFYLQATLIALVALCIGKLFFIKRADLTFLDDEYDLDIPVEKVLDQKRDTTAT